eukprot:GFYU01009496.1.p1 GENE.GFYU01009496.1~~GFYU01009496.1.p1  ORF type:complete len:421 (-),score=15.71 GFYU01009496.1:35-1297(-)
MAFSIQDYMVKSVQFHCLVMQTMDMTLPSVLGFSLIVLSRDTAGAHKLCFVPFIRHTGEVGAVAIANVDRTAKTAWWATIELSDSIEFRLPEYGWQIIADENRLDVSTVFFFPCSDNHDKLYLGEHINPQQPDQGRVNFARHSILRHLGHLKVDFDTTVEMSVDRLFTNPWLIAERERMENEEAGRGHVYDDDFHADSSPEMDFNERVQIIVNNFRRNIGTEFPESGPLTDYERLQLVSPLLNVIQSVEDTEDMNMTRSRYGGSNATRQPSHNVAGEGIRLADNYICLDSDSDEARHLEGRGQGKRLVHRAAKPPPVGRVVSESGGIPSNNRLTVAPTSNNPLPPQRMYYEDERRIQETEWRGGVRDTDWERERERQRSRDTDGERDRGWDGDRDRSRDGMYYNPKRLRMESPEHLTRGR